MDPREQAALQRAVELSADIELQLAGAPGAAPLLALLEMARADCAIAIVALSSVDPEDPKAIRKHQNEIAVFDLLVIKLKQLVANGRDAADEISEEQRLDYAIALDLAPEDLDEALRLATPSDQ